MVGPHCGFYLVPLEKDVMYMINGNIQFFSKEYYSLSSTWVTYVLPVIWSRSFFLWNNIPGLMLIVNLPLLACIIFPSSYTSAENISYCAQKTCQCLRFLSSLYRCIKTSFPWHKKKEKKKKGEVLWDGFPSSPSTMHLAALTTLSFVFTVRLQSI